MAAFVSGVDFPRSVSSGVKRAITNNAKSMIAKKPKVDESPLLPSLLSYDDFNERTNCLGVISDIIRDRIFVCLPHNHMGVVRIEEASLLSADQINLSDHFQIGEYVVCSCISPIDDYGSSKYIDVSFLPERINATRSNLKDGEVIAGCVTNIEDDNIFVNVGTCDNIQVVIKQKHLKRFKVRDTGKSRPLIVGDQVIGEIKTTVSPRVYRLVPVHTSRIYPKDATFNSLSPGSRVEGTCTKAYHSGIIVETCNTQAYVSRQNFEDFFEDEGKFSGGNKLQFVVLVVNPVKKSILLSMQQNHFDLMPSNASKISRGICLDASVVDVGSGRAILKCRCENTQILGFSFRSNAVQNETTELGKVLPLGSTVRCRVMFHNLLEGYLIVATRKDIVEEPYFSVSDMTVGDFVEGKIERHDEDGLIIRMSRFLTGIVPFNHIIDRATTDIDAKRFPVDRKVTARVLDLPPNSGSIILTMKPSFMKQSLMKPGANFSELVFKQKRAIPMVVRYLKEGCWLVTSFASVQGLVKRIDGNLQLFPGMAISAKATDEVSKVGGLTFFEVVKVCGDYGNQNVKVGEVLDCVVTDKNTNGGYLIVNSGSNVGMILRNTELSDFPENSKFLFDCYTPGSPIKCMVTSFERGMCTVTARKSFIHVVEKGGSLPAEISEVNEGDVILAVIRRITQKGVGISSIGNLRGFVSRSSLNVPASFETEWQNQFRVGQTVCVSIIHIICKDEFIHCSMTSRQVSTFQKSLLSPQSYLEFYLSERKQIMEILCCGIDKDIPRIESIQCLDDKSYRTRSGQTVKIASSILSDAKHCRIVGQDFECEDGTHISPYYIALSTESKYASFSRYRVVCTDEKVSFKPVGTSIDEFYHEGCIVSRGKVVCKVDSVEKLNEVGWQLQLTVDGNSKSRMIVPAGFDQQVVEAILFHGRELALLATPVVPLSEELIGQCCFAYCLPPSKHSQNCFTALTSLGYKAKVNDLCYFDTPEWKVPVQAWILNIYGDDRLELCLYDYTRETIKVPALVSSRVKGKGANVVVGPFSKHKVPSSGFLPLTEMMDHFTKPDSKFNVGSRLKLAYVGVHKNRAIFSCRPSRLGSNWPVKDMPLDHNSVLKKGQHCRGFVSSMTDFTLKIQLGVGVIATVQQEPIIVPFGKLVEKEDMINCFVERSKHIKSKEKLSVTATVDFPMLVLLRCIHRAGRKYGGMTDEVARSLFENTAIRHTVTSEINQKRKKLTKKRSSIRTSNVGIEYTNDMFPDPADIKVILSDEADENNQNDSIEWDGDENDLSALKKTTEDTEEYVNNSNTTAEPSSGATALDYERLIALDCNHSFNWIQYIAFELQQANIDAARALAEKALSTIDTRQTEERWNVWVAYLNLESLHGSEESMSKLLCRAMQENDQTKVLTVMSRICLDSGKLKECDTILQKICKMHSKELKPWLDLIRFRYENNRVDAAREAMNQAIDILPLARNHIDLICKCAQLEFSFGLADKAKAMFEKLVSTYPKRVDIWSVYVHCFIKTNQIQEARAIFQRIAQLSNVSSKRLLPLYKQFIEFEKRYGNEETLATAEDLTLVD